MASRHRFKKRKPGHHDLAAAGHASRGRADRRPRGDGRHPANYGPFHADRGGNVPGHEERLQQTHPLPHHFDDDERKDEREQRVANLHGATKVHHIHHSAGSLTDDEIDELHRHASKGDGAISVKHHVHGRKESKRKEPEHLSGGGSAEGGLPGVLVAIIEGVGHAAKGHHSRHPDRDEECDPEDEECED